MTCEQQKTVEELFLYLLLMSLPSAKLTPPQPQMSQLIEKWVLVPCNQGAFRSFGRGQESPVIHAIVKLTKTEVDLEITILLPLPPKG